tara:strand:- start:200 stop:313 length:114 start_codon:yes stop_codon:yes gene_type:complete
MIMISEVMKLKRQIRFLTKQIENLKSKLKKPEKESEN